ncbi:MAG: T9SS C-terminal target domain-containing protein, partial [Bacteroidetes bacterium]
IIFLAGSSLSQDILAQPCNLDAEVFTFIFNERTYHVVKENLKWEDAAACAVTRGGKLVEINNQQEQQAVFEGIANASIVPSATYAGEYEEIAFVWLGGNDLEFEGDWAWDGDNSGGGLLFWAGTTTGAAVGGSFINWGNDPDNADNQDGLAMAITEWPQGEAGEWSDLKVSNDLFYVVEYSTLLNTSTPLTQTNLVRIFPNPAESFFQLENNSGFDITSVEILDARGAVVRKFSSPSDNTFEVTDLTPGIYLVKTILNSGSLVISQLSVN